MSSGGAKSIGLRSGSYGSLQLPQQTIGDGFALPSQSPPHAGSAGPRKAPKMVPQGKERLLHKIYKLAGRRRAGMLLLLLVSAALFSSLFSFTTNDDDAPSAAEITDGFSSQVRNFVNPGWTYFVDSKPPVPLNESRTTVRNQKKELSHTRDDKLQEIFRKFPSTPILKEHPCESFSLPPPPPPSDRKRTGPRPCPVCYVSVEQAMALMPRWPSASPILKNLNYVSQENLVQKGPTGGSLFGGYPSLKQRDKYFDIKESMRIHCGFVNGKRPGQGSGFDIDEADLLEMEECVGVVVASAIFGNYDVLQQPENISKYSKETVCFFMFVDEETEAYIKNTTTLGTSNRVGIWRVVVVRNLPYSDARRNGKVPKLLLHRLFPNVRYSLWIDGKLKLVRDPYLVLERFLWRRNVSFAISRHYSRFDVFEEAEANKAAGKYENASIDYQIKFYKREGLTHYSAAKLPILSDVPEGCVIIREHIPITDLFTCLWFNEVDRFTSRDQLSFSTVRDKIMAKVNWTVDMFLDCERRNFVIQIYHRELLEQKMASSPPAPVARVMPKPRLVGSPGNEFPKASSSRKILPKRSREKKLGLKRHRLKPPRIGKDSSYL